MGDEYQNRRDIDKIYDDLYSQITGSLNVLKFKENSPYRNISSKEGDIGTIDAIIDYYNLTEKGGGGGGDLSNYYTKEEINGILSSYVTSDFANTHYAPLVHTHSVSDITGLSDVAVSGDYDDLENIPSTFPPSAHSHNWDSVTGKPSTFPPSSHNHDDRYYTESEVDSALSNKADTTDVPTKTSDLTNDGADGTNVFVSNNDSRLSDARTPTAHSHSTLDVSNSYQYSFIGSNLFSQKLINDAINIKLRDIGEGIPSKTSDLTNDGEDGSNPFVSDDDSRLSDARTPTAHTHDDRYYTETETDTLLSGKAPSTHTHDESEITLESGHYNINTDPFPYPLFAETQDELNNYLYNKANIDVPHTVAEIFTHIDTYYDYYQ